MLIHFSSTLRPLSGEGCFRRVCIMLLNTWVFFRCQKGWRSVVRCLCACMQPTFFDTSTPPSDPLLTGEGLCNVEGRSELVCWFGRRPERFSSDAHSWVAVGVFRFACCSRIRCWSLRKKKDRTKTSGSRFFEKSCPYYTSIGFFLGDVFLSRCHGPLTDSLFSFVVTTPRHHWSVANMEWDPMASVGRMLTMWCSGSWCKLH